MHGQKCGDDDKSVGGCEMNGSFGRFVVCGGGKGSIRGRRLRRESHLFLGPFPRWISRMIIVGGGIETDRAAGAGFASEGGHARECFFDLDMIDVDAMIGGDDAQRVVD